MSSDRLFVGQLPPDTTENDLRDYFSKYGSISDVFLPRSTRPKRIAFVTFDDKKSLYSALADDKCVIRGEEVVLTQALPKGAAPPNPAPAAAYGAANTRLFVNGIPPDTTEQELRTFFSNFGALADVFFKVPNPFGFITFEQEASMFVALSTDPMLFKGVTLTAEVAKPKPGRGGPLAPAWSSPYAAHGHAAHPGHYGAPAYARAPAPAASNVPNTRIFVGSLTPAVSEEDIRAYFSQFGEVEDMFRPGRSDGTFAFLTFANQTAMFSALAQDVHMCHEVELRVTEAEPRPPKGYPSMPVSSKRMDSKKEYRCFIAQINVAITDDDLRSYFAQFGAVKDIYRPGASRGGAVDFGFCVYEDQKGMAAALAQEQHVVKNHEIAVTRARERPGDRAAAAPRAPMHHHPAAPSAGLLDYQQQSYNAYYQHVQHAQAQHAQAQHAQHAAAAAAAAAAAPQAAAYGQQGAGAAQAYPGYGYAEMYQQQYGMDPSAAAAAAAAYGQQPAAQNAYASTSRAPKTAARYSPY